MRDARAGGDPEPLGPGMTAHMTLLRDGRRREGVRRRRLHARGLDPAVRRTAARSPTSGTARGRALSTRRCESAGSRRVRHDSRLRFPADAPPRPRRPRPRVRAHRCRRRPHGRRRATSRRTRLGCGSRRRCRSRSASASSSRRDAGEPLGWIVEPQRRRFLTLRWNGRLGGARVRGRQLSDPARRRRARGSPRLRSGSTGPRRASRTSTRTIAAASRSRATTSG